VTYGYDSLNRWNSASSQAATGADCWGQSVPSGGYDRYGNLLTINPSQCSPPGLSKSVNGNNQVSGYSYDAAGDVTYDGFYNYSWDAENRLALAAGVTYTYDGDGQRVEKSTGTLYWRGGGGSVVAETDTSGNTLDEYIFFGARIARRDSSGNVYYYFGNHLGSAAITDATGTLCYDADFYPIGGELDFTNNCAQNYKFAGMEQDPETGDYHNQYRQYASNLGRWLSPDPSGTAAVSLANPQTWNMYAYVTNNPTTLNDATGLDGSGYGPGCGGYAQPSCYFQASYDSNYDPNSWVLPNNINCMAGEYGCAGTPSEIQLAEATCVAWVNTVTENNWFLQGFIVQKGIGGIYYSQWLAGAAAAQFADPSTIANGVEESTNLYMNPDGTYSYMFPSSGNAFESDFNPDDVPLGTTYAGDAHTHVALGLQTFGEQFSPTLCGGELCDIGLAMAPWNNGQPWFLATPQGRIEVFLPSAAGSMPYGCVVVGSAVSPGPGLSNVAVPTCN
jgi:RHS repeat-associated protein